MADFDARMAALRERFMEQTVREAKAIADHAEAGQWDEVRQLCHGLAGRAGMFGFAPLGEAAHAVEQAIDAGSPRKWLDPLIFRVVETAACIGRDGGLMR